MPNSAHLSPAQRKHLLDALSLQLAQLNQHKALRLQGQSETAHANQTRQDDADDATQRAGDREVEAAVADIDSAEFDAVSAALLRMHGIGYGHCSDCDARIPYARLNAEPQALRCLACQTIYEGKN
jgi:DnaK suppressor protein